MLHLNCGADGYQYLNRSGCSTLIAVDDKEQFDITIVSHLSVCVLTLPMECHAYYTYAHAQHVRTT